ncbi:MAG TPA: SIMPL domain-containing protein [Micromonosporaceae bacterium]
MTDTPTVAVRGEATREVEPEIAQFSVTVAARDKDRSRTLSRLADRAQAVRAVIEGYGDAIERTETSGLRVYPEMKRSGEKVGAYQGSVTTTVTVSDFGVLGEVILRLADQDQTSVAGPWWSLRRQSPVYRQARRDAIDDALNRARDYADALGARVVRLVELADAGLSSAPIPLARGGAGGMAFRSMAATEGEPRIELDPQRQTVHAEVEARFEISEPGVLAGD